MRIALAVGMMLAWHHVAQAEPTKADALAVLDAWVKAQNAGDVAAYDALYSASFVGIKRTSNGLATKLTRARWQADRKKMFKIKQEVAAENPSVVIKDGKVTIQLTQRYKSGSYADHGDKILRLAADKAGKLLIEREELLYSAPGWDADPKAELDASALVAPITVEVKQEALDPTAVGGCGSVTYTIALTDAKKKKLTADVGGGFVPLKKASEVMTADVKSDELFAFGEWCAGGADYYRILRSGDSLVVRYKGEDEGTADEPPPQAKWETRLTVRLPADAKLR